MTLPSRPARLVAAFFLLVLLAGVVTAFWPLGQAPDQMPRGFPWVEQVKAKYAYPLLKRSALYSMRQYFDSAGEMAKVIAWVDSGGERARFYREIYPIMEQRCISCHGAGLTRGNVSLIDYGDVAKVALVKGVPTKKLLEMTHIHLLAIGGLLLLIALFWLQTSYALWLKLLLIIMSGVALIVDVSGWWLSKYRPELAYLVFGAGLALYGGMLLMAVLILYQLIWFKESIHSSS